MMESYWLEPRSTWNNLSFAVGVESNDKGFVLVGFPIYRFNGGTKNAGDFISKVFRNFGASSRIYSQSKNSLR